MKWIVRRTYAEFAIAGALALVWPNSALGINDEEKEWLQAQYDEYFSERFGEPGDRPPDEVLEKRCIYEIKQATRIISLNAYFRGHYVKVAKLWAKCATVKSLPTLVDALKVSRRMNTAQFMLRGYMRNAHERSSGTGVTWHLLWPELSKIWFRLKREKEGDEDYHNALIKALTRSGAQVKPRLLMDRIVAAGPEIRQGFYDQLLDEDTELRRDLIFPLMDVIAPQPSVKDSKRMPPTRKELIAMLNSGKPLTVTVAKNYAAAYEPIDLAKQQIVKDLQSADEYYQILEAMRKTYLLLISQTNGLTDDEREEVFKVMDNFVRKLEEMHDAGESIDADRKGGWVDYSNRLLEHEQLRIPLVVKEFLIAPGRFGGRPVDDAPMFKSRRETVRHHLNWLNQALDELPDDVPTESFNGTIKRWRKRLRDRDGGGS